MRREPPVNGDRPQQVPVQRAHVRQGQALGRGQAHDEIPQRGDEEARQSPFVQGHDRPAGGRVHPRILLRLA